MGVHDMRRAAVVFLAWLLGMGAVQVEIRVEKVGEVSNQQLGGPRLVFDPLRVKRWRCPPRLWHVVSVAREKPAPDRRALDSGPRQPCSEVNDDRRLLLDIYEAVPMQPSVRDPARALLAAS